jgi:hypothetical protein
MNAATTRGTQHKAESGKRKAENFVRISAAQFAENLRRSRIVRAADKVDRFERLAIQGLSVLFQLGEKVEELSGAGAALVGPTDPYGTIAYHRGFDPKRLGEEIDGMIAEGCRKVVIHVVEPDLSAKGGQA